VARGDGVPRARAARRRRRAGARREPRAELAADAQLVAGDVCLVDGQGGGGGGSRGRVGGLWRSTGVRLGGADGGGGLGGRRSALAVDRGFGPLGTGLWTRGGGGVVGAELC